MTVVGCAESKQAAISLSCSLLQRLDRPRRIACRDEASFPDHKYERTLQYTQALPGGLQVKDLCPFFIGKWTLIDRDINIYTLHDLLGIPET
jgi:hypothetical protein